MRTKLVGDLRSRPRLPPPSSNTTRAATDTGVREQTVRSRDIIINDEHSGGAWDRAYTARHEWFPSAQRKHCVVRDSRTSQQRGPGPFLPEQIDRTQFSQARLRGSPRTLLYQRRQRHLHQTAVNSLALPSFGQHQAFQRAAQAQRSRLQARQRTGSLRFPRRLGS